MPDLVVEVRSKNDTAAEVESKVASYLQGGVKVVWVADPSAKTIAAYRPTPSRVFFRESDTVSVERHNSGPCASWSRNFLGSKLPQGIC